MRETLELIVETLTESLTKGDILLILTSPHESLVEETIPESQLVHLFTKARILRLSYVVAHDYYDADKWTWKECCKYANKVLEKCGERKYAARTIMKWHRRFILTRTMPHPYESKRQYQPWFFRNHPAAEQIAR